MYGLDSTLLFTLLGEINIMKKPLGPLKFHYIEKELMSCMENHKQYYVFKSCCCCLILSSVYSGHATTVTYSFYSIMKPPIITCVELVFLINSHGLKLYPSPVYL